MIVKIHPSEINGIIHAPASKSAMQRACALALVTEGETMISNPGKSNDDLAALRVIQSLGAELKNSGESLLVSSKGVKPVTTEINCGESGLGLRMFAPIAALSGNEIILNGSGSLLQRPMNFFDEVFPLLDVQVQTNQGKLPLRIRGPLQPADISIDGSLSSQFLTGLLISFAASCTKPVTISVNNLKSKPYIDLTLQMMKHFGLNAENQNYDEFHFDTKKIEASPKRAYTVEGDWSGAAFILVAGAIAGAVTVEGLDINSAQADKAILKVLELTGSNITFDENNISVRQTELKPFEFNATDCPDLFPPLTALAAYCNGVSVIKGVNRLIHKESNRAITLQKEFGKMGVMVEINDDQMMIHGEGKISGGIVFSHHDHRIAMACAIAALKANEPTSIQNAEAINKSYPDFYDHLQKLNAVVQLT